MRELKFMAWDGEQMVSPDFIDRYGVAHWKENSIPESSNIIVQYTGLKDSYLNEEYFDFIIEEDNGIKRIIEDGFSVVTFVNIANKSDIKYFWQLGKHKIIGNIHENKELLNNAT